MFKIIFSHLNNQVINKPSLSSKINKWGLSKSDLNVSRFENTMMFYKKELLNSKYNTKRVLNYSYYLTTEGLFFTLSTLALIIILTTFLGSLLFFIQTETIMTTLKFSVLFLIKNPLIFTLIGLYLMLMTILLLFSKNKKYLLLKIR